MFLIYQSCLSISGCNVKLGCRHENPSLLIDHFYWICSHIALLYETGEKECGVDSSKQNISVENTFFVTISNL